MAKTIEQIREELDAKIPASAVAEREGGGRKLSYLEGWYVIDRLNKVLGQGNWDYRVDEMKCVREGEIETRRGPTHSVHYIAKVCLTVYGLDGQSADKFTYVGRTFEDYGYGDGTDSSNPGKAHELAVKEAVTDGIKRCAKNLGMSMGLALYSKTQENVDDGEEAKPVARAVAQSAAKPKPQTVAAPKPQTVAAPKPAPVAPVAAPVPASVPAEAPLARKDVNEAISAIANVLGDKAGQGDAKKAKIAEIKAHITKTYGVEKKEALNDVQANELYNFLKGQLNGRE